MKQGAILISVIIPVFNRSWQFRRALESLRMQSFKDFEVLVCDDGSTEDITSVVNEFKEDLNIQIIRMPNSGGPAKPRNKGLELAKGEWVAFLDSDDWWDANRLEVVSNNLSEDVDVLYHPLRVVRESSSTKSREKRLSIGDSLNGDPLKQMLLEGNPIPTSATIVRRDFLLSQHGMSEDRGLVALEDFDCWLRLAVNGAHFYFVRECLGSYWIGSDAISNISLKQIEGQKLLYQRIEPQINSSWHRNALARQNYVLGSLYFRMGRYDLAFNSLKIASPLKNWRQALKRRALVIFSLLKIASNKIKNLFFTKA